MTRVRRQTDDGDMTFGAGSQNYLIDSADMVAQIIGTRLGLLVGEWFLDVTDGTPWDEDILGAHTQQTRDAAIKARVLGTVGVEEILSYSSYVLDRGFRVSMTVQTIYSADPVEVTQNFL